jgi:hypothetical protein
MYIFFVIERNLEELSLIVLRKLGPYAIARECGAELGALKPNDSPVKYTSI